MKVWLSLLLIGLTSCVAQQVSPISSESARHVSAKAHAELASEYLNRKQMAFALEEFQNAATIDPTYSPAFSGLGLVYESLQEDAKAEDNFKKAIKLDPESSESHNNYGSFLCSRNRIDESINQFMLALNNPLYATPAFAYLNAGLCSLKKPDTRNAEIYLKKALEIQPLLHPAAYYLAKIYLERKQYNYANEAIQYSMTSNPDSKTLWLGINIARGLGDKNAESSYALELKGKYPDSPETQLLLSGK